LTQFNQREIEGADKARALYRKLGYPAQNHFEHMLLNNFIHNCPITSEDAKRALVIYGPSVPALKGKTVRQKSHHVPTLQRVSIPSDIIENNTNVTLCMDILYVNSNPFFHTISRKIQFCTVAPITTRTKASLATEAKAILNLYTTRGFTIPDIHADGEFACILNKVLPSHLNITDPDDHVPEVEHSIHTVKERIRAITHGLPFRRLPRILVTGITEHAVKVLNQFPAKNGASDTMSLLTIMTGLPCPDYNKLAVEVGTYCQVFEDNDPTNTQKARET